MEAVDQKNEAIDTGAETLSDEQKAARCRQNLAAAVEAVTREAERLGVKVIGQ